MSRRRVVAAVLLSLLMVSSGCLGFLTGGTKTFESNPVSVSEGARNDAGYQQTRKGAQTVTRNFSVAGSTYTVKVVNHVAEYAKTVNAGPLSDAKVARFTVFATPEVSVGGQTLNPIADLSERELARRLSEKYQSLGNLEHVDNRTVTVLGKERTVERFKGTATTKGGQQIDVYVTLTKFKHGDDFIVAVAIYPQKIDEKSNVNTLLKGIEHSTGS